MTSNKAAQLKAIEERKAELAAREKALKAQISQDERKADTRRKIIIGAMVISLALKHPKTAKWLRDSVAKYILKAEDLALLAPLLDTLPVEPELPSASQLPRPPLTVVASEQPTSESFAAIFEQPAQA